jgi:hypothetical protein
MHSKNVKHLQTICKYGHFVADAGMADDRCLGIDAYNQGFCYDPVIWVNEVTNERPAIKESHMGFLRKIITHTCHSCGDTHVSREVLYRKPTKIETVSLVGISAIAPNS